MVEAARPDIAQIKIDAIEAIARDPSLQTMTAWTLIKEILEAPGWTVFHVLRRQAARATDPERAEG